jgi:predicted transglutaminase-like cysteine proteinase
MLVALQQSAFANIIGMPRNLTVRSERIAFQTPTLAPLAFMKFCMRYPDECRKSRTAFRPGPVKLNAERFAKLMNINRAVNVAIRFQANLRGVVGEEWVINPTSGDCNDYAVSKRAQLRALGWPARSLLLSEVVTSWGEHHLVLVVRTNKGDLVLDSLTGAIRPWFQARYQWVRAQLPGDPMSWRTLTSRSMDV